MILIVRPLVQELLTCLFIFVLSSISLYSIPIISCCPLLDNSFTVVPFRTTYLQLSSSGHPIYSCPLPDNLFKVVPFRTTISRTRYGPRYYSHHIDTGRLVRTDVSWEQDSLLLYLISCLNV